MKRSFAALAFVCASAQPAAAGNTVDMTGVWAHRVVTRSVSKLPIIGKVENESRYYALVQVTQDGDKLALRNRPCWVRIVGEITKVKTIVPDEVLAVMGPSQRTGTISGSDVTIDRAVDVLGARLKDEFRDPLPQTVDDATQWDEDGDGHPGVTIRIMGPIDGDVYVVQRSWNHLVGALSDDGNVVHGLVTWETEQNVLDGTSIFLRSSPHSKPHQDKERSYFEMQRMPAGTSCEVIRQKNDSLFGSLK